MSIKVFSWDQAASELGAEWKSLIISLDLNVSLHPDWMNITVASQDLNKKAFVVSIEMPGGDIAIVPLLCRKVWMGGVPFRCLDLASNLVSYHAEIPSSGSMQFVITSLLRCKQLPVWDVFRLDNLVVGGSTSYAISDLSGSNSIKVMHYAGEQSPYLPVAGNWTDFKKKLTTKLRSNMGRYSRNVIESGSLKLEWFESGCDTDKLLAAMLDIERRSWKSSDNIAIRAESKEGSYYRSLVPWLSDNGLQANVLYEGGRPIAYSLCADWRGWVGQLKTSFANDCEIRGIGFYVNQMSIERAFNSGSREYDFLGRAAPHKMQWTDMTRTHESCWIMAPHFTGRVKIGIKKCTGMLTAALRRGNLEGAV